MIFGRLSFPGERWYVVIVWVPQMVRDENKFGNTAVTNGFAFTEVMANLYTDAFVLWQIIKQTAFCIVCTFHRKTKSQHSLYFKCQDWRHWICMLFCL